jgi:hypothetical protein
MKIKENVHICVFKRHNQLIEEQNSEGKVIIMSLK